MTDNRRPTFSFGIILGVLVLLAGAVFILTGGDLGGTKKVQSDADLPRVTSPKPPTTGNTGSR
jgi:hypothetical protein